jgi:hypothetical protein
MQKNYNLITLGRAKRKKVKQNGQKSGDKKKQSPPHATACYRVLCLLFKRTYRFVPTA